MIITLIGMAGGGKSTVGKVLARQLGYGFIDTDHLIENSTGKALQSLIDEMGDMALIDIEEGCILSLELQDNCIISTGGSVVYSERSMDFLKRTSTVVFLDVPFATLKRRLSNIADRGVVGLKNGTLHDLYRERIPLYQKYADITVKVSGSDAVKKVAKKVLDSLSL
ncbi:shikimate kinase [Methanolobus sp. ZRKC3]|uniref:shikimate kinase n=1 Tax=Methanolobus sp. ZRKC3 TaxID=3125786 RepID=UPI00324AF635